MKLWSSKTADDKFSLWIRNRDGRCMRCGKVGKLTNSHFWNRNISALRYDPCNCDALCWMPCHIDWEKRKNGPYMDFKKKQLGEERYNELRTIAYQSKMTRSQAIKNLMGWLK